MVTIPQLRLSGWKEIEELGKLRHDYIPACLSGCRLFTLLPLSSPDSLGAGRVRKYAGRKYDETTEKGAV